MLLKYKNKDWLYNQYVCQFRSQEDISQEFNVTHKTICYWINKFGIERKNTESELPVEILCHNCKLATTKTLYYLKSRIRKGNFNFFCSQNCADKFHSNNMKGDSNPNFNGTWHGTDIRLLYTKEERTEWSKRYILRLKESGEFEERMIKLNEGHKKFFSTQEGKLKRIQCGINSHKLQARKGKETSIEREVRENLQTMSVEFLQEKEMYYWVADFFLPKYNLVIEVQGDYWHGNLNKYRYEDLNEQQKKRKKRDKVKRDYIKDKKRHNYLEIWETDIRKGFTHEIIIHKLEEITNKNLHILVD